jgi:hypothetical protein
MGEKGENRSFRSRPVTPTPLRNERVLPAVGELVVVNEYHTGRPRRPGLFRVVAQRGGVPRVGRGRAGGLHGALQARHGKPRPPALVEYLVDGFGGWHDWFQLERVTS